MKKLLLPIATLAALVGGLAIAKPELLNRVGIGVTPVGDIMAHPTQHRGKTVTIRGKVINQAGILGVGTYELQDGSGSIWVLTQAGIPELQTEVFIKGQPNEGVTIAGKNFGTTIQEEKRW